MPTTQHPTPRANLTNGVGLASRVGLGVIGLGTVAALAGCSGQTSSTDSDAGAGASTSGAASVPAASPASYKDGSYTAEGGYVSPGGNEKIKVAITLKDSVVTAVTVTPESDDPNGQQYQAQFASGISAIVVGKRIDSLTGVSRVAGSSLTSQGFAAAVAKIEAQAS